MRFFEKLVVAYFFGPPCIYKKQTQLKKYVGLRLRHTCVYNSLEFVIY